MVGVPQNDLFSTNDDSWNAMKSFSSKTLVSIIISVIHVSALHMSMYVALRNNSIVNLAPVIGCG